jgi:transcription antitermination factor NusG
MRLSIMEAGYHDAAMREWFAVQVWSGREQVSARHLRQRGYEVFLPCYSQRRRWSDRIKVVDRALFPGYMFCRLDTNVAGRIITAPGVIRIVGDRSGPLPVAAHEIEAIQRIVETQLSAEPWPVSYVGQRVRIERGPLTGIEGTVLVVKNRHRLIVSVSLLQRAVAVEIDSEWVTVPPATLVG